MTYYVGSTQPLTTTCSYSYINIYSTSECIYISFGIYLYSAISCSVLYAKTIIFSFSFIHLSLFFPKPPKTTRLTMASGMYVNQPLSLSTTLFFYID